MNRGLSVVDTLKILKNDQLTTEELFKSRVLGWCIEWVRTIFQMQKSYILLHLLYKLTVSFIASSILPRF